MAVNSVSASMIQSTGTRMSNTNPTLRKTKRSARSISPPRASIPNDSARARSYEMSMEQAATANAKIA